MNDIKMVSISKLKPYKKNARVITDEAVSKVANSIKEFGFRNPILVDAKTNEIIAGHTRLKAAKKLDLKEVPCLMVDDLSEDKIKALRLADNKTGEFSYWDLEILEKELKEVMDKIDMGSVGFDEYITNLEPEDDTSKERGFSAAIENEECIVKKGDTWKLGNHTLHCGKYEDLLDVIKERVAMAITAPENNTSLELFPFLSGVVRDGGSIYIFRSSERLEDWLIDFKKYFMWGQLLVWDKIDFEMDKEHYHNQYELILQGWNKGAEGARVWNGCGNESTILRDKDLQELTKEELEIKYKKLQNECRSDLISIVKPLKVNTKPLQLLSEIIRDNTKLGETVIDPVIGIGCTLMACEQCGRICVGVDEDPLKLSKAIRRWENMSGNKAICV